MKGEGEKSKGMKGKIIIKKKAKQGVPEEMLKWISCCCIAFLRSLGMNFWPMDSVIILHPMLGFLVTVSVWYSNFVHMSQSIWVTSPANGAYFS